ncbi:MAG TPA: NB-ARC domain-containing protein, partial [Ktedonobacterales bacterium]
MRFLRDVLRRWWIVVGFIAASAIQTIGQILLQSGLAGLNPDGLRSTAIGQLAAARGPIFWPIAVALVLLIPIGWVAHIDHERERKALAEQHEVELRERTVEAVVRDHVAQSIALMSAPPLDLLNTPPHFVDRAEALRWLIENLRDAPGGATLSIEGLGGLGKTSLAAEALQQARQLNLFPGGTAVVLCENRTDSMAILRAVLKRFSRSSALDAAEDADLASLAQRLLTGKRALVVLDNVEPELRLGDIVGPLQAVGATILLTARFRVPAELKTGALRLDVLDEADAIEVFKEYYGRPVSDETLAAVRQIVSATGRLTLAIVLAAQNAADNERAIPALAEELAGAEAVLDLTEDAQVLSNRAARGVRIVFEQSYRALSDPAQRLFQALAVMPTGEFGREAALAVGRGVGVERVEAALDLLVRRALFEQFAGPGGAERLRQHPLLRAFAADKADTASRAVAGRAMAEYYARYLAEHSADFRVLDREYPNILGGLRWVHDRAVTPESPVEVAWAADLTARYFTTLHRYLFLAGHNRDATKILSWGIEAARAVGDRALEASLVTDSGIPFRDQRNYEPAIERYEAG